MSSEETFAPTIGLRLSMRTQTWYWECVSLFCAFLILSQFYLVRKWCQRYMKSSSLSPLPSACKHISQWLTISRKKSQLSEIVKDRPKIPATKLGCSVSSSNSQGEPLQNNYDNNKSKMAVAEVNVNINNNKNRTAVAKLNLHIKFKTSS